MARKKNRFDFLQMKKKGQKIVYLTSYDYPTASLAEGAGVDMLLVGDSLGMCVYGYSGTIPVTMDQCIVHSEAVRRGAPNTFIIGDMPFMSYQESVESAIHNAGRFHKEASVDAIKLEGGYRVIEQIRGIVASGMLVMGHIGLTPQSSGILGGFKVQGRTADAALDLIRDAGVIQEAGAFALLLEAVPPEVGKIITDELEIPVLGIGAGADCDGQLLIVSDMLGLFQAFTPKFVRKYANLAETISGAMEAYAEEVRKRQFPDKEHTYNMVEGEYEKLQKLLSSERDDK